MLNLLIWFAKRRGWFSWNDDLDKITINTNDNFEILHFYSEESLNFDKMFFATLSILYGIDKVEFNLDQSGKNKERKQEFYKLIKWFAQNNGQFELIENKNNIIIVKCQGYSCSFRTPESNNFDLEWEYLFPVINSLYKNIIYSKEKEIICDNH